MRVSETINLFLFAKMLAAQGFLSFGLMDVISKMTRNENITVETVGKICKALNCTPNDMLEFVSDSE